MDELIERFNLDHVNKSGAIFDVERLNFFNTHYLKTSDINELYTILLKYLKKYDEDFYKTLQKSDEEYNKNILNELKTRIKKFDELKDLSIFFYNDPKIASDELFINPKMKITDMEVVKKSLVLTKELLENTNNLVDSIDSIKSFFVEGIKAAEMKNGQVLWPARVALSGEEFSPGALEMVYLLGRDESIKRLSKVLETI
jgi:nondiscriminating glutamyl-tRNA synthetase